MSNGQSRVAGGQKVQVRQYNVEGQYNNKKSPSSPLTGKAGVVGTGR